MQGHYGYNMLQNKVLRRATDPCQYCCCSCSVDAGFRDRCSKVQPSENLPKRGQTRVNGAVCSPHYSRKNQILAALERAARVAALDGQVRREQINAFLEAIEYLSQQHLGPTASE